MSRHYCTDMIEKTNYQEQLEMPEWKSRRDSIIKRDNKRCSFCGKGATIAIQVGEKYLNLGRNYSNPDIVCSSCAINYTGKTLQDFSRENKIKNARHGKIPESDYYGVLLENGCFFYTSCDVIDAKKSYILELIGPVGVNVLALYENRGEYDEKILPAIYITDKANLLNVHHKHYILGRFAWEYEDNELVTLCQSCHEKVHRLCDVNVYANVHGELRNMNYTPCTRCNGVGYFPEYRNVQNGICFRCRGARYEEMITYEDLLAEEINKIKTEKSNEPSKL